MHTTSGGRESQGANLCHKCGWPFPNPHPSAKQRRAHKKVCGTIEGYKLVGSDSENDDRLSDDDRKTLSPKLAEKSDSEKRSGGIDGRSNRTEDEVFSDAVTEFPDSGFSPGNEEGSNDARVVTADVEKSGKKDLTVFYSFNDNALPGTIEPSSNRTGSSQIKNTEFHKTGTTLTGSNLESQVHVSSSTEESAAILTGDKSQLACDIQPLEPVIPIHASQENKAINAGADVSDSSMTYAVQETDAKGKNEMNPVSSVAPFSPCEYPGRTLEAEFKCQQIEKMTSDLMSATEDVVSKEEQGAEMASNMSWGATVESVESVELSDASDTAHNKLCAEQGLNSASPVTSLDDFSGKGEGNENVYELAVPADISTARHSVFMLEEFKDYKGVKLHKSVTLDSCEINNDKKDNVEDPVLEDHTSSQTTQLSEVSKASASDEGSMPVVETPSAEGERGEPQIRLTSNEGADECGGPACAVKMGMEQSSPVSSMEKLQPSDVSDNSLYIGVRETAMKVSYDVNPIVAPSDANAIDLHDAGNPGNLTTEMYNGVGKVKKGRVEAEDYKNNIVTTSCSATIPPEFQVTPAISLHESDDAGDHVKDKIEKCDGVGLKSKQEPPEGKLQLETAFESNSSPHENPPVAEDIMGVSVKNLPQTVLTNLNDVSDIQNVSKLPEVKGNDKAQAECYVEHGRNVDMLERTSEYNAIKAPGLLLLDTESSKQAVTKDAVDMSLMNLPETKLTSLNEASDTWVVSKQPEVKGSDRAQGDCDVDGRNVDSLERTSEDHATKATCLLPSDTESSMQGSVVDDDNYAREHGSGHSGINQSSRGENDANNFVKHHFGASVTDTLVDSLSQTDSLEGNWGSVSVLSTQSDMQAFVDAETSPSTAEAEKLNLKKPEGTTEREHSEKSDIFEAPSFMTLVEPGGRSDQKVAASYIEKTQNLEQQKASSQTGWFPTLTNVVNESQGRKKNEEIIAKVTNWSTGKQHTSLKNLLGEANIETKPKSPSPNPRESKAPPVQKDETMAKEKSAVVTTASTILSSELPTAEPAKRETGTELNSPARYPADIKRDRRKGKGWVHFVCCSSVN